MTADPLAERVRLAYEAVHGRLWRAVLAFTGSREMTDDAVAEAWAQVLRRGAGVRDPGAWVWRASFRIAAGELQRQRRDGGSSGTAAPDIGVELPDPAVDLITALRLLTHQQRACIVLCDLAGHSAPEAAHVLGTTAATVRVQRMRARRRLRQILEDDDG